jgi:ribosomal protein S18 acetylase RimI-like enzyme
MPIQLPEIRLSCVNAEGKEMGWLQYTDLEYDYCIRIQRLYIKPDYRQQGLGTALISHLKNQYPSSPIYAHLIRVDKDVSLNLVMDLFKQNGFYIKQIVGLEAEGYYNFE